MCGPGSASASWPRAGRVPGPSPGHGGAEPLLLAEGLRFAYGGTEVLAGVDVEARAGEVTAIVGPNGSGKSTLLELLAGVLRPRAGVVSRRGRLALVVQRPSAPATLPLTAREVVALGVRRGEREAGGSGGAGRLAVLRRGERRAAARAAVTEALERVELAERAAEPLAALSGGQRQRVFLAQGIVGRPGLLLCDEPGAGLDERSADRARAILREEAARGAAVICVTHDDRAIAEADRVLRLAPPAPH
ncbi:hypothetical protein B4915_00145 [Leucobacter massiliensis]|uniref:ABC transporter domain-containing protein n=1 Tax=Leucobacter massiliensis TaxID=1686285 RepID=A0A2S9QSU2_9MICO|nr:hypothetical protein B4915_00145 [Leucobacter massiliensis]